MMQYCVRCGSKLHHGSAFCPHCGKPISITSDENDRWEEMGKFLAHSSLSIAKGFLFILLGGAVFACAVSSMILLVIGATFLYQYAANGRFILPAFWMAEFQLGALSGVPLMLGGVAAIFIALLFALVVIFILKIFSAWRKERTKWKEAVI